MAWAPEVVLGQNVWRRVARLPEPAGSVFGAGWVEYSVERVIDTPRSATRGGYVGIDEVVVLVDGSGHRVRTTTMTLYGLGGHYEVCGVDRNYR